MDKRRRLLTIIASLSAIICSFGGQLFWTAPDPRIGLTHMIISHPPGNKPDLVFARASPPSNFVGVARWQCTTNFNRWIDADHRVIFAAKANATVSLRLPNSSVPTTLFANEFFRVIWDRRTLAMATNWNIIGVAGNRIWECTPQVFVIGDDVAALLKVRVVVKPVQLADNPPTFEDTNGRLAIEIDNSQVKTERMHLGAPGYLIERNYEFVLAPSYHKTQFIVVRAEFYEDL